MVKNLPAGQETQVGSLGWEDPLGKGNGNPLQDSCLENPMDRGARWAIQSMGSERVGHDWATHTSYSYCQMNFFMNSSTTFNTCIDSWSHHHNQSKSINQKKLCCSVIIKSSSLPAPSNPLLIFRSYSFSFSKMSREWNHAAFWGLYSSLRFIRW